MGKKASIMVPDGKEHRQNLIEEEGYREGLLIDSEQSGGVVELTIQDRKDGEIITAVVSNLSGIYGANKQALGSEAKSKIDELYNMGNQKPLDLEEVANELFVTKEMKDGLRFVYHESLR